MGSHCPYLTFLYMVFVDLDLYIILVIILSVLPPSVLVTPLVSLYFSLRLVHGKTNIMLCSSFTIYTFVVIYQ